MSPYGLPPDESIGKITLGAPFTHTDRMRSNYADRNFTATGYYVDGPNGVVLSHADPGWLKPTNLLDLNVSWSSVGGTPVELSFFATNATKEKYITYTPGLFQGNYLDPSGNTASGVETGNVAPHRMYGMRAKVHF